MQAGSSVVGGGTVASCNPHADDSLTYTSAEGLYKTDSMTMCCPRRTWHRMQHGMAVPAVVWCFLRLLWGQHSPYALDFKEYVREYSLSYNLLL